MRFRPLPVMTFMSAVSFVILILFGNWQWARYQSKQAGVESQIEWTELSGTPLPDTRRIVYAYANGQSAWRTVLAYDTVDGVAFVPLTIAYDVNPPDTVVLPEPLPGLIRGIWRTPRGAGPFDARDKPAERIYYTHDPQRLAAGLPAVLADRVLPRIFEPEYLIAGAPSAAPVRNPMTEPEDTQRLPPERHLGYALTWWGLAAALFGVYLAFHHQRGRLRFRQETGG